MSLPSPGRPYAFASWIDRSRRRILGVSLALVVVSVVAAAGMPVHADFSYLLPPSAHSVRQLRAIEQRTQVIGTMMAAVESADPAARERVAQALRTRLEALPKELVASVTFDDGPARRFGWNNRYLFASTDDLQQARDVLSKKIERAKIKANPLYVDLESDEGGAPATEGEDAAQRLQDRLDDAEKNKDAPTPFVAKDGTLQLIIVRTTFVSGDVARGRELLALAREAVRQSEAPGVQIGLTGDVVTTVAEQKSILSGMLLATIVTVVLVFAGMLLYYRSFRGVMALLWALAVGSLATFAFARLAIGHLNVATAFLSSIVIGNGINAGLMLLARYFEERRRGLAGVTLLAAAIAGTWRGTLAATLTASVAYASLTVTSFRGFRDFGVIGGVGMLLCWTATYLILPAVLAVLERRRPMGGLHEPALGRLLLRLLPRRLDVIAFGALAATSFAAAGAAHYLWSWPLEVNFRNLRSSSPEIREARAWLAKIDAGFGKGISGGFVIALPDRDSAARVAAQLRAVDAGKPESGRLFGKINSLQDLLPDDQAQKLRVLADIRHLLDDKSIDKLSDDDRKEALRLRPPDNLRPLTEEDVPIGLAWPFTERNGTRGRLLLASAGLGYDVWNANDLIKWTTQVSSLDLGRDALIGGSMFVFADVLRSVEEDGPRATIAALIGSFIAVWLVVGLRRHGVITLLCGASGTLFMLAAASLLGLKVNFLDFVALPITIGIGIDYSVNIVTRAQQEGSDGSRAALATAGSAVAVCSYTTIVGYGSLLLSQNQGIRSFGEAAILGEFTCLGVALVLAPALLHRWGRSVRR